MQQPAETTCYGTSASAAPSFVSATDDGRFSGNGRARLSCELSLRMPHEMSPGKTFVSDLAT